MNPFKDLNSTPQAKQIANEYCKQQYATRPDIRLAKNLGVERQAECRILILSLKQK